VNARQVILRPVVSEKSYALLAANKYTFRVADRANKTQVRQAVEEIFGVRVEGVRTAWVKPKPKRRGFTSGTRRRWKKAIVTLHAEDTIELFEGQEIG
jgi:large subunit ribosomal protein L23